MTTRDAGSTSTGTALAVTAVTTVATALSYIAIISAAKAEKGNEKISLAHLFANKEEENEEEGAGEAMTNTSINNSGSHTGIDRREQWYNARMGSKASASGADSAASIKMAMSTETGATAEGDDTIYELADYPDIFGSSSMCSQDSDSDISYDAESSNSFRNSLINLFENDESFKGLMYESERGTVADFDPDNPFTPCIYLDYNGTTPIDRRVFARMIPFLTLHFGNPSSSHAYGAVPKRAISNARRSILDLLHTNSNDIDDATVEDSIVFTGCGTEADNMAIHLALNSTPPKRRKKKHIVTTNVEHPAIAECLKVLQDKGEIDVTYVPVNSEGSVSAKQVMKAIRDETVLVTIMLANNESGALQPVKEIAPYCRKRGILFHTDAAQAVGKVSISLDEMGISSAVDMVTIVAHKFGGPKGIACLYIRPGCLTEHGRKEPKSIGYGSSGVLLHGGGQEHGRRAGTENVPYIVGMGFAAEILNSYTSKKKHRRWRKNASKMRTLRSRLLFRFIEAFQEIDNDIVRENGPKDPMKRLPNTLSIGFKNVNSAELLQNVQTKVACSAGSACHSSGGKISGVLIAMNVPTEYARGTLRLSVGPTTMIDEVDKAADIIIEEIKRQLKI